jgi:hypothetical protein
MSIYGRRLIARRLFKSILDQIRSPEAIDLHKWNAENIVKHFAYLLPDDKRFTEADIEAVIHEVNIAAPEPWLVNHLVSAGVLVQNTGYRRTIGWYIWIPPYGEMFQQYFVPNSVRSAYKQLLRAASKNPEPERRDVSDRLQRLKSQLTDPAQCVFLEETLNCLTVGANRAAIVMGWNLAFDHLTQWIFRHQLSAYNKELTSQFKDRKKGIYCDPVVDYRDFSATTERTVLDVCEAET